MYHSYFGLDEQTFSIAVNPRYLYMSAQHKEALAHLLYGVKSGGFVMLSGEVGTGKTTIIRCLLEQIPEIADLAIVMNPSASARDLLCSICDEFGVGYAPDETSLKILTDKLTEFLVKNHSRGRKSIVLIDEAQLLRISTLEQVRLLTNLETNTQKLLQIILVGQPELNELLAKPALRQLSQRITARYHLRPLADTETEAYIKHRLSIGGMPAGRNPFPPNIINKIHSISRGIPRLVNVLCDRMLLGAYSQGVATVDMAICNQATVEVLGEGSVVDTGPRYHPAVYAGVGALGVLIICFIVWMFLGGDSPSSGSLQSAEQAEVQSRVVAIGNKQTAAPVELDVARRSISKYWVESQDQAMESLLDALEIPHTGSPDLCWEISKMDFRCEDQIADNWVEFKEINRPAVLTIKTPGKNIAYVTLVGLDQEDAWVMVGLNLVRIRLDDLGVLWTGKYVFTWARPRAYKEPVGKGSRGRIVTWIAEQFAALDGMDTPITRSHFNGALETRVKMFQEKYNLDNDGVVGLQTLLRMNEALGIESSLTELESTLTGAL